MYIYIYMISIYLLPQHNVEGLLFSWPWPCLSSLLDFPFLDPLRKTAAVVFVMFSWELLPSLTLNRDPLSPRRFLLHNDIYPSTLCCGSCFLLALTVLVVIVGFPLFGPPRENGCCCFRYETLFKHMILSFFPQLNVVGLLFFWPWPCLSSLLDFLFLDPLGKTAAVVFATKPFLSIWF